jgi:hypothetical protein
VPVRWPVWWFEKQWCSAKGWGCAKQRDFTL